MLTTLCVLGLFVLSVFFGVALYGYENWDFVKNLFKKKENNTSGGAGHTAK